MVAGGPCHRFICCHPPLRLGCFSLLGGRRVQGRLHQGPLTGLPPLASARLPALPLPLPELQSSRAHARTQSTRTTNMPTHKSVNIEGIEILLVFWYTLGHFKGNFQILLGGLGINAGTNVPTHKSVNIKGTDIVGFLIIFIANCDKSFTKHMYLLICIMLFFVQLWRMD